MGARMCLFYWLLLTRLVSDEMEVASCYIYSHFIVPCMGFLINIVRIVYFLSLRNEICSNTTHTL